MPLLQIPLLGTLLRFIYRVGFWIEGVAVMAITLLLSILTVAGHFLRRVAAFFSPSLLFERISRLGSWLLKQLGRMSRAVSKGAVAAAHSVVHDFCYWAAGLAVLSIAALAIAGRYYTVALQLEVGGKAVGIVAQEADFAEVVSSVEQNLASVLGENYVMKSSFSSRFCLVKRVAVTDDKSLYQNVYGIIASEIGDRYGLYVDGELIGATKEEALIQRQLDAVKAPYLTGAEGETAEFLKKVEIRCGLYPESKLLSEEQLKEKLSASGDPAYYTIEEEDYLSDISEKTGLSRAALYALNPGLDDTKLVPGKKLIVTQPEVYLGVRVTKNVTYTEEIAYTTHRIKDDTLYVNQTKVKTEGQKGEKAVTAKVVYIDGVKQSSEVVHTEVTKEPVARELFVGSKERIRASSKSAVAVAASSIRASAGKGDFIRPIDGGYVSCGFGGYRGHTGTDLTYRSGAYGKPVYASAGGRVIYAQTSGGGYGKLIKIQHDNGMVTYYAHLSAIHVSEGDRVSQGQQIGAIGATGRAYGAHLHFEIRVDGSPVNAMNYIS